MRTSAELKKWHGKKKKSGVVNIWHDSDMIEFADHYVKLKLEKLKGK